MHIWPQILALLVGNLNRSTVLGAVVLTLQVLRTGWDLMMLQKSWKPSSSSWNMAR